MKKHLLLFAFSALALNSCKDDDILLYELDLLKGDWKTEKTEIISGADNTTVLNTDVPDFCGKKNITHFDIDMSTSYQSFSTSGTMCISNFIKGEYEYNADTKELIIEYDNDGPQAFEVVILSSSELRLKQKFGNIDINGDQKIDVSYISFIR
ncbi:lipocalin family protein [Chryseobacterium sp.]|uniref:lipocalin family protein n=1 Tax=Chryseobacterium sp. TaxID=1871047 RepID=UPI0028A27FDD|nr:lipocalin family protein [Chryseobacterium sp.]